MVSFSDVLFQRRANDSFAPFSARLRGDLSRRTRSRVLRADAAVAAPRRRAEQPAGRARRLPRRSAAAVRAGSPVAWTRHRRGDRADRAADRRRRRAQAGVRADLAGRLLLEKKKKKIRTPR